MVITLPLLKKLLDLSSKVSTAITNSTVVRTHASNKTYLESRVQAVMNTNMKNFRVSKERFVYDRGPSDRVFEYARWRVEDGDRDHKFVNRRFPELENARRAFLGDEPDVS